MRYLGLIVTLWFAALLPTNSLALGLGEIEVNSFLNQPLNAEIEVISARPGEIDDLLVSLASREAFTRAGLSRPRHLSELRFAVRKSEAGDQAVILVTTKSAVKEPFLNFLIEADWSKGRVLREFTVLLDPPFYADQPAPTESASPEAEPEEPAAVEEASVTEIAEQSDLTTTAESSEQITEPIALSEDSSEPAEVPEPVAASEPATEETVADESANVIEGDILVVKGDTLWSIASRYKDDAHSMSQVMLAFLRANPDAFNDGNVNNMNAGAVLRVPSADELDAIGQQEAYAEVLEQNGLWDEYVARVTGTTPAVADEVGVAAEGEVADSGEAAAEGSGELSLLLPGDGDTEATGISDAADVEELRTKLAMAEEELEASRVENRELESRIVELQARLSKVEELQKMIEIEDDSLAQLQADQAQEQQEAVAAETLSETTEAEEALLEELLAEEAAAQAEEEAAIKDALAEDAVAEEPAVEADTDALVDDDVLVDDDALVDDEVVAEAETTTVAPPAPVIVTEPATGTQSFLDGIIPAGLGDMIPSLDSITGDPIMLAAIGGILVLLLLLVMIKRRKAGSDDEPALAVADDDDMFAGDDEEELTPIHLAEEVETEGTDIKLPTAEDITGPEAPGEPEPEPEPEPAPEPKDELASTTVVQAEDMPEPEAPAPDAAAPGEQDDVLNEVDVYLAYGLYDNAEELLNTNLTSNPDRADYRSKLLDTYFATKKVDAFAKEAETLKSMGDAGSRYWDRVQVMGYELAPDNPLFSDAKDSGLSAADLEIAKPEAADFDLGSGDEDDTNFSTTDFDLSEDTGGGELGETQHLEEAGEVAATQVISQVEQADELPGLEDEDVTDIRAEVPEADTSLEIPDEIGDELEFSIDEEDQVEPEPEPALELELEPEVEADDAEIEMEFDIEGDEDISEADIGAEFEAVLEEGDALDLEAAEDSGPTDEDVLEIADLEDVPEFEETAVLDDELGYEPTAVIPGLDTSGADADEDSEIDLGMDDTSEVGEDEADASDELELEIAEEEDDDEDISIIDFGGDDFDEATALMDAVADEVAMDVDVEDSEEVKTGTFAPGDFEEPTALMDSVPDIDDIGDLGLPDDVDEVSTKLDLARAFIDMGDNEGARGSLEEVMSEGNEEQKAEAKALLDKI